MALAAANAHKTMQAQMTKLAIVPTNTASERGNGNETASHMAESADTA